ncbi:2Fe-2S iron-sulfur cluster-binding protein [Candidatus Poriferisodalis sp.]|uniref:2Fe-2S iron-sulfur cluster-binding protein n=1 Tax=Candidatus Poriferisodalis sp. TaxID=3101277 RepID=UPI003AF74D33
MSVETDPAQHAAPDGLISRSHLGIEPFALYRPGSLADAASMIAAGAWAHAGGIDVAQRLRNGEVAPALVPLCKPGRSSPSGLEVLDEISLGDGVLFIGAAVTHARIETDRLVRTVRPDLADAWRTIGNVRIRSAGTLGGNLMAFDSGYDAAPILAAAGAELIFMEPDGSGRRCAVADRPHDRLLVGCEVPLAGYVVYERSLKPVASVAVGDNHIAIGCAYPEVEVLPSGAADAAAARALLGALPDPTDDVFASTAYRRRVIDVLVGRCLELHAAGAMNDGGLGSDGAYPPDASRREAVVSTGPPAASLPDDSEPQRIGGDARQPRRPGLCAEMPPQTAKLRKEGVTATFRDVTYPRGLLVDIELRLNGEPFSASAPASEMLVDTIRSRAGLGGTRVGCDQAVCGACTVLVDGEPTASCSTFAWQSDGRDVLTIESGHMTTAGDLTTGPAAALPEVQRAFAEFSAFQCGYCTPGLILTASALLARHRDPDRTTICDWLDSNVCRCTGYLMVIEAVEAASAALRSPSSPMQDGAP